MTPLRVVLGEDDYLVREGIRLLLEASDAVELVAVCTDYGSLLAAIAEQHVDVVVTDIRMPPSKTDEGIRLAAELRETHPTMGVVVLSQFGDPRYALRLLDGGAEGRAYLLKERVARSSQLVAAIEEVAHGGSAVDPKIVEMLLRAGPRNERSPLAELTAREREVLQHVAQGESNATIAAELFLTKRAVEKHINAIFSKLRLPDDNVVSRRVKAALLYLADETRGWSTPD